MASGTILLELIDTGSYNITFQGKITWTSTSNGSSANTSLVSAILYARKQKASSATTGKSWNGYISIGGTKSSFSSLSSSLSITNDWVQVYSYSRTVAHEDDGTCKIAIAGSITGPSGTTLASITSSGSETVTLDTIARYATFKTHSIGTITQESIKVNWSADVSCSAVQYSLNNGSWTTPSTTASGSYTITGLSSGTTYSIRTRIQRSDTKLWTISGTLSATTTDYVIKYKLNESWKNAIPYIKINGTWKKAIPFIKVNGSWKKGIY